MNGLASLSNTKPKQRAIAMAIVCGLLLVQPSCIPNLRKPNPAPPVPEDFSRPISPDNSAEVRIEEFYNDPVLLGLIDQALAGNQELRILNENIQIASNEVLARRGAYLPFVTAGGGPSFNKASSFSPEGAGLLDDPFRPGMFIPNPYGNFLLGTNLFWQIDIWRQLRNARDAAAQRVLAATEERNYFVTRLVAEVAENYYVLMALDARLANLNRIIELQERSLEMASARMRAARGTDMPVQRFQAEVRKNQSQKLIVNQDIIQTANRINFVLGRFPQTVTRTPVNFIDLKMHSLSLGVPSQLLLNRPDIRQAERELAAAGLDVKVARARFFPVVTITGSVGYEAFNFRYLFLTPEALVGNIAAGAIGPVINFKAIKADYLSASAKQLQTVYHYQRVVINAFTEVFNRMAKVENYGTSIEIKRQQVQALEAAVAAATFLWQLPRDQLPVGEVPIDYLDVLTAQNELFDGIRDLIDTKSEQLSAIVNTYQALGGGAYLLPMPILDSLRSQHKKHLRRLQASEAAAMGPGPSSTPAAAMGPAPPSTPSAARGSGPYSTPGAETGSQPIPAPGAETGLPPLPPPGAETAPGPYSTPASGPSPQPPPPPGAEPGPQRPAPPPASEPGPQRPAPPPASEPGPQLRPTLMGDGTGPGAVSTTPIGPPA